MIDFKQVRSSATKADRKTVLLLRELMFKYENLCLDRRQTEKAKDFWNAGVQIDSIAYKRWPDWLAVNIPRKKHDA